jgi:hypothetical protein
MTTHFIAGVKFWLSATGRPDNPVPSVTTDQIRHRLIPSGGLRAFGATVVVLMTANCSTIGSTAHSVQPTTASPAAPRPSQPPALISGHVTDEIGGKPVPGAVVEWRRGSQQQQGTTDATGLYIFSVPAQAGSPPGSAGVSVAAWSNLYEVARRDVEIRSGQTVLSDFRLRQKDATEIGQILGRVTNTTTAQGVGGVTITIVGAGNPISTQTLADGSYLVPGVGLGQVLTIRAITEFPPCLAEGERSFAITRPVAIQDFALPGVYTSQLHCPSSIPRKLPPS